LYLSVLLLPSVPISDTLPESFNMFLVRHTYYSLLSYRSALLLSFYQKDVHVATF
jgi:hypothetical protein